MGRAESLYSMGGKRPRRATENAVPVFTPESYTPPDRETVWGMGLGSRIRRDKLFWFGALDGYSRNDPGVATVKHPYLCANVRCTRRPGLCQPSSDADAGALRPLGLTVQDTGNDALCPMPR